MRSFESSNHCLAPLPTVHAAAAWFCRLPQNHGDGMDNLSRYGREECNGHAGFNVEHTGMGAAEEGTECTKFFPDDLKEVQNHLVQRVRTEATACSRM